jgi:hypothetical protein
MMDYKGCSYCKHADKTENEQPCVSCAANYANKFTPISVKTNGEIIQNNNESLIDFIMLVQNALKNNLITFTPGGLKDWLQEPAKNSVSLPTGNK